MLTFKSKPASLSISHSLLLFSTTLLFISSSTFNLPIVFAYSRKIPYSFPSPTNPKTMSNSDNASSGCFSGLVRLLLCKGSLQTHPSDQILEPELFHNVKIDHVKNNEAKIQASSTTPGVVARLMGLDSLPDTKWVPKSTTPDSVPRSRSVNFMDYLLKVDLAESLHRRVRTSVSFREVPTSINQENHDFFVLDLDNMDKNAKMESRLRKSEVGLGKRSNEEKNPRNNKKISMLKDEPGRVSGKQVSTFSSCRGGRDSTGSVSCSKKNVQRKRGETSKAKGVMKPTNQKEVMVESKFMKKMKNKKHSTEEMLCTGECSSEDSSHTSVLDLEFPIHYGISFPDNARPVGLKPTKKSSLRKVANLGYSSPLVNAGDVESRAVKKNISGSDAEYYIEVARTLCKLTEEDVKESNWVTKNVSLEEICVEFMHQILDQLLHQVVEELVEI